MRQYRVKVCIGKCEKLCEEKDLFIDEEFWEKQSVSLEDVLREIEERIYEESKNIKMELEDLVEDIDCGKTRCVVTYKVKSEESVWDIITKKDLFTGKRNRLRKEKVLTKEDIYGKLVTRSEDENTKIRIDIEEVG